MVWMMAMVAVLLVLGGVFLGKVVEEVFWGEEVERARKTCNQQNFNAGLAVAGLVIAVREYAGHEIHVDRMATIEALRKLDGRDPKEVLAEMEELIEARGEETARQKLQRQMLNHLN